MGADEKRMTVCCLIQRDLMPGPRRLYCFGNGFNGFSSLNDRVCHNNVLPLTDSCL